MPSRLSRSVSSTRPTGSAGLEAAAAEQGHRSTRARLGAARGRLHGVAGDIASARQASRRRWGWSPTCRCPTCARACSSPPERLWAGRQATEADELLRQAREGYVRLGAAAYVRRCDKSSRPGLVPPGRGCRSHCRASGSSFGGLAAHAAGAGGRRPRRGGLTNKEVAAQMFISVKTVQYHLTRVYSRLGIRSRPELAAAHVPRADA